MKRALLLAVVVALPAAAQAPDLAASAVVGPSQSTPGGQVNLAATVRNLGDGPVGGELKYTWFISSDRGVTVSDVVIATGITAMNLMPGQSVNLLDQLSLPAGLAAGHHWIGLCANWDSQRNGGEFVVTETSLANNCAQEANPVTITAGQVSITTPPTLPPATQFAPWGVRLQARGGNGSYEWSLEPGSSLPPGVYLDRLGDLRGSPTVTGAFSFTVKVTSVSTATAVLSLQVAGGAMALAVVDQELPSAEFGRLYDRPLVATGGKPPYTWAPVASAVLPPGLGIAPDGRVTGRPALAGAYSFGVQVSDAGGATATRTVTLRVTTPVGLHVGVTHLATAYLQRDYSQKLTAVGGKAPYTWTVLAVQSLPEDVTQVPGPLLDAFPDGVGLALEGDLLRGAPRKAGLFALTLRVRDANSAEDYTRLLLKVSYDEPIAIVTTTLPDAFVGSDYLIKLSHNRQVGGAAAVFSLPCVQVPSTMGFACQPETSRQLLPRGLELREDGTIIGRPVQAEEGVHAFLIAVTDEEGRRDVRGLSITLRPEPLPQSGCAVPGFAAPSLLLSLLVLAGIRRKRASP